jgi:hypothetical protein
LAVIWTILGSSSRAERYRSEETQTAVSKQQRGEQSSVRRGNWGLSRKLSGMIGALFLAVGLFWLLTLIWQPQRGLTLALPRLPAASPTVSTVQIPALYTAGVTLGTPSQPARLDQQQALLLASEWEPAAARKARQTQARYVLLTYSPHNASRPQIENAPAWMVIYEQVPLEPADAAVDPTPFPQSSYDLYVFSVATSGKELLSVWS